MTIDTPTTERDFKGIVIKKGEALVFAGATINRARVAERLRLIAEAWPVGADVTYTDAVQNTYTGTVYLDTPANIPGMHLGTPSAWCLHRGVGWVCVSWHNDFAPYIKWLPAARLHRVTKGGRK